VDQAFLRKRSASQVASKLLEREFTLRHSSFLVWERMPVGVFHEFLWAQLDIESCYWPDLRLATPVDKYVAVFSARDTRFWPWMRQKPPLFCNKQSVSKLQCFFVVLFGDLESCQSEHPPIRLVDRFARPSVPGCRRFVISAVLRCLTNAGLSREQSLRSLSSSFICIPL